jgi:hypothetical protein
MNTLFPFGFPWQSVLYLVLYVVTLVIHVVFMNYVLAGSGYVALAGLFSRGDRSGMVRPMVATVRDWLPFMLGAAITAGVAPLLFVQILYKYNFYTANLLGFHRWMAILPILIVAFYILYLLKADRIRQWPRVVSISLSVIAFLCFAFVAYSWTENYLLSVAGRDVWRDAYVDDSLFYGETQLVPRLAIWFIGALPTMALMVSWQLWYAQGVDRPEVGGEVRHCATLAMAGLAATLIAGIVYFSVAGGQLRLAFYSWLAGPWFVLAVLGFAAQAFAWWRQRPASSFESKWLTLASIGAVLTLLGMTVTREAIRLKVIGGSEFESVLAPHHAEAAEKGGIVVFLFFFVANILVIAYCFRLVKKGLVAQAEA